MFSSIQLQFANETSANWHLRYSEEWITMSMKAPHKGPFLICVHGDEPPSFGRDCWFRPAASEVNIWLVRVSASICYSLWGKTTSIRLPVENGLISSRFPPPSRLVPSRTSPGWVTLTLANYVPFCALASLYYPCRTFNSSRINDYLAHESRYVHLVWLSGCKRHVFVEEVTWGRTGKHRESQLASSAQPLSGSGSFSLWFFSSGAYLKFKIICVKPFF